MPELLSDLNRALVKAFAFCLLGTMLCVLLGAFSDVLAVYMLDAPTATLWAHQGVTIKALGGIQFLYHAKLCAEVKEVHLRNFKNHVTLLLFHTFLCTGQAGVITHKILNEIYDTGFTALHERNEDKHDMRGDAYDCG